MKVLWSRTCCISIHDSSEDLKVERGSGKNERPNHIAEAHAWLSKVTEKLKLPNMMKAYISVSL
jgi:hypothetical protein